MTMFSSPTGTFKIFIRYLQVGRSTSEQKILWLLLQGFELATFQLRVRRWLLWGYMLHCCRRTLGERSFQYIGPVIWNSLSFSVRHATSLSSFKSKLKTHLFCLLISRFLSSVSIKPMTTMLVFLRCGCVCVRVWVWHAYLLCKRPGLS